MNLARHAAGPSCRKVASVIAVVLFASASAAEFSSTTKGTTQVVTGTEYPDWAQRDELEHRLLSPLEALRRKSVRDIAATRVEQESLDISKERFLLYVPQQPGERGYRLLVFVPPWEGAELPLGWASALEREHTIFVSALASGNSADILERREPLALIAAANVMHRFPIDHESVYVSGFSGGSRVAQRLALGYPDVFHGALLNDGSDPIGDAQAPIPSAELFRAFQESTRIVYVTGEEDQEVLAHDAQSMQSMLHWCAFDLQSIPMYHQGHGVADSSALSHALQLLRSRTPQDANRLSTCRDRIARDLAVDLQRVQSSLAENRPDRARDLLLKVDRRYGGLAAPKTLELAQIIPSGR